MTAKTMHLTASLEDYLEAIYCIVQEKHAVRAKDISKRLKVNRSSVTGALHALAQRKLINYAPYDVIDLTSAGTTLAKDVVHRHETLKMFFTKVLSIQETDAEDAACKMEHAVPPKILQRFLDFVNFVECCPRGGEKWIKGFGYYCESPKQAGNCEKCVSLVLKGIKNMKQVEEKQEQKAINLWDMQPGQKAIISKINSSGKKNSRLCDMGLTAGSTIEVIRVAPLGDPVEVKIKGYNLSLRKDEAQQIEVKPI